MVGAVRVQNEAVKVAVSSGVVDQRVCAATPAVGYDATAATVTRYNDAVSPVSRYVGAAASTGRCNATASPAVVSGWLR